MSYTGHIHKGKVVFEKPIDLPEGTKVTVKKSPAKKKLRLVEDSATPKNGQSRKNRQTIPTLYERLKPIIGKAKDLPSDFAENHDHYIHGVPKRAKR